MKLKDVLILGMMLAFAMLSFVNAEMGCCYDTNSGSCAMNSEYSSCVDNGGSFSGSTSCSISSCTKGCCVLGSSTQYATSRECEILSKQRGFSYPGSFTSSDEAGCYNLGKSQTRGACVFSLGVDKNCKYETYAECGSGDFHENTLCSEPSLNTSCSQTGETMCYNENVYYKDSCGNPAAQKQVCDYDSGSLCTTKTSKEAYCKSLNCEGGKNNGDSWCVDLYGNGGIGIKKPSELGVPQGEGAPGSSPAVGSRYFKQSCLNGEITIEPCADFRLETCEQKNSGAKCIANHAETCSDANNAEADENTGSKVSEDDCDSENCFVLKPEGSTCGQFDFGNSGGIYRGSTMTVCGASLTEQGNSLIQIYQRTYPGQTPITTLVGQTDDALIKDLHLEMCVPNMKQGQKFWGSDDSTSSSTKSSSSGSSSSSSGSSSSDSSAKDVCSVGTYTSPIQFEKITGTWYFHLDKDTGGDYYGNAGLLNATKEKWGDVGDDDELSCFGDNPYCGYAGTVYNGGMNSQIPVNPAIISFLSDRCKALGDCAVEWNWVGQDIGSFSIFGSTIITTNPEEGPFYIKCFKDKINGNSALRCPFKFECKPWQAAPGNDYCEKCGADGLPCSKYRCLALGSDCAYYEPEGANKGYCQANNDFEPPSISCQDCPKELLPFTGATFTITTSEDAKCKFDLNHAAAKLDDMEYDFGEGYSAVHSVVLNLPGQVNGINASDIGAKEYDLITKDGKYTLYVRCEDVAGNGKTSGAYAINFNVLAGPDTTPPFLKDFSPVSGSAIKYNTTEKLISFKMNEPAECKWSLKDEDYNLMNNNFNCDTSIKTDGVLDEYSCSGILKNVSLNMTQGETKYYIKCKDQPWLEGKEYNLSSTLIYKRNVHDSKNDYTYILRPSEKLLINAITPIGTISKPISNTSFQIETSTSGGGAGGIAECKWKLSETSDFNSTAFTRFFNTNSNNHKQIITNRNESQYYIDVKCQDKSENIAESFGSFYLKVDNTAPILTRLFNKLGQLNIETNENSFCVFSLDKKQGCFFDYTNNGSAMNGLNKQHTTTWLNDKKYYIICKDYQGNYNNGCLANIRTY